LEPSIQERFKKKAAEFAVRFVEPGMVVGLGHGSTAIYAVRKIAELLQSGELKGVRGVPCSVNMEEEAERLGIPLVRIGDVPCVDVTIDGADEVDHNLDLIKGLGGALLREKIVAQISRREVIVADASKWVSSLGRGPVPVEVSPFGWETQAYYLKTLGARVIPRRQAGGEFFLTDQNNLILDCHFDRSGLRPRWFASQLDARAGIIGHGLFLGLTTDVIIASEDGVQHLRRDACGPACP
jgi:ribose 5-phosphate isomerase A